MRKVLEQAVATRNRVNAAAEDRQAGWAGREDQLDPARFDPAYGEMQRVQGERPADRHDPQRTTAENTRLLDDCLQRRRAERAEILRRANEINPTAEGTPFNGWIPDVPTEVRVVRATDRRWSGE